LSYELPGDKKRIIESVVGLFETGKPGGGDYTTCVYLADGAGITYGKHQAIDRSGSLDAIVQRYILLGGVYRDDLKKFRTLLEENGTVGFEPDDLPAQVTDLMHLLFITGSDPVMHQAQDEVFDEWYWNPMEVKCKELKLELPLSWLVMYDSSIHSGPAGIDRTRNLFPQVPPSKGGTEKVWTTAYIEARREWLATHSKTILHGTVYRQDAMLDLVAAGNWDLTTPFQVAKPRATIT